MNNLNVETTVPLHANGHERNLHEMLIHIFDYNILTVTKRGAKPHTYETYADTK